MTVTFEEGKIYTKDTGVKSPFNFGGEPDPSYFYLHNGHFNHADFAGGSTLRSTKSNLQAELLERELN